MDMLWLIVAFALMAILPDLLWRRRRYPRRKGPIPVPPRRKPAPAKTGEDAAGNEISAQETTAPVQPPIVPAAMPVRPAIAPVSVPHRVRPAAWSQLTPQARELYAGFVWSEIWQEPLAYRRRLIKK